MSSVKKEYAALLADRLHRSASRRFLPYEFRIAQTLEDLLDAYYLVYREYAARGYCKEKPSEIHYTYFCMLPESRTFLLRKKKSRRISGTASLILDSPFGLPMETLFDRQLRRIRKEGRRLAEVTLLTLSSKISDDEIFPVKNKNKLLNVFNFFRVLFQYARSSGVTDLVIAVNPKHESIYQYLTFKSLGAIRAYPEACGNPARAMHLDLIRFCHPKFRNREVQKYFFGGSVHDFKTRPAHWDFENIEKLFLIAPPLASEPLSILETYLQSSPVLK